MVVHHSRDTAHKQWSETSALALKGLLKLVKATRSIEMDPSIVVYPVMEIARSAVGNANGEMELHGPALELVFSVLRIIVCDTLSSSTSDNIAAFVWKQLQSMAEDCFLSPEWTADLLTRLTDLWTASPRGQLETFIMTSAPNILEILKVISFRENAASPTGSSKLPAIEESIQRGIVSLLSLIVDAHPAAVMIAVDRGCEIIYSGNRVVTNGSSEGISMTVSASLRASISDMILKLLRASNRDFGCAVLEKVLWLRYYVMMRSIADDDGVSGGENIPSALQKVWSASSLLAGIQNLKSHLRKNSTRIAAVHGSVKELNEQSREIADKLFVAALQCSTPLDMTVHFAAVVAVLKGNDGEESDGAVIKVVGDALQAFLKSERSV